jgi:hypothetical protein
MAENPGSTIQRVREERKSEQHQQTLLKLIDARAHTID